MSKASYSRFRSALMDIYRFSGYDMGEDFKKDLSTFMCSIKREVVRERVEKGMVLDEGKNPMSFEVYKCLCKSLHKSEDIENVFCHLFLVLEWNLTARSDNCLQMSLTHIQWRNDSLIFFFGKSKRNQEGDANHHPWHVYSNPFEPALCPVLALGKYLLAFPHIILDEKNSLFPGTSQYARFSDLLSKLFILEKSNLVSLEVDPNILGNHSIRKGAISHVSAGCTVSPPMAAICLRAAWSMGNVKDRYIHCEKAGDEFVGRSITGISSLSRHFATSPVYFEPDAVEDGDMYEELDKKVENLISDTLVRKTKTSGATFAMLKYVVANLCYHYQFLENTLPLNHCVRSHPLFVAIFIVKLGRMLYSDSHGTVHSIRQFSLVYLLILW